MPVVESSNKRIAKNTLMLYIRMLISMLVGLYTSRVVLQTLGAEVYGIYGVVGGVVGVFVMTNILGEVLDSFRLCLPMIGGMFINTDFFLLLKDVNPNPASLFTRFISFIG